MVGARQFDEQEVIAIAIDVFWRKGLHDATMQDLATATGVQRGSLYNAYGDKEAIFLLAFDQYAGQFLETAGKALAQGEACGQAPKVLRRDHCEYDKRFASAGLPDNAHRARCGYFEHRTCASACKVCSAGLSKSSAKPLAPLPAS